LVHIDELGVPNPTLLDLGIIKKRADVKFFEQHLRFLPRAYLAPEVVGKFEFAEEADLAALPRDFDWPKPDQYTDVYGLGLLLFEMLAGKAAFSDHLRRNQYIFHRILDVEDRPDKNLIREVEGLQYLITNTLKYNPRDRVSLNVLSDKLRVDYHHFPKKEKLLSPGGLRKRWESVRSWFSDDA
jgi:hypothetical protein